TASTAPGTAPPRSPTASRSSCGSHSRDSSSAGRRAGSCTPLSRSSRHASSPRSRRERGTTADRRATAREVGVAGQVTIGIDMGGTKVLGLAVDDEGVVLSEVRLATPGRRSVGENEPDTEGFELVVEALASVTEQLRDTIDVEVTSVGGGAPGLVDNTGVLRYAPNLPRGTGLDIADRLSTRLGGMRTVVDNDATCATVAEWAFGAATGVTDAVMVTLGTGIGGGIIAGGHVVRGASGFGGEIGHMVVDPTGPVCPCGKRGCW